MKNIIDIMASKVNSNKRKLILLGFYAGLSIGLGGFLYAGALSQVEISFVTKLICSSIFSIGLIIIIFTKTQLFTGNVLMVLLFSSKTIRYRSIFRNWFFVYLGNFLGSIVFAICIYYFLPDSLIRTLTTISQKKTLLQFDDALMKAIFCNMLVCLAVVFGIKCKRTVFKLAGIIIPITLFVHLGLEHSIANMFFIPLGLVLELGLDVQVLRLFLENLIPVTIGNIIGGGILALFLKTLLGAYRSTKWGKMH
jgi:formate/nitrite transporter